MKIGVIGAGRIGGNVAWLLAAAGHEIVVSSTTTTPSQWWQRCVAPRPPDVAGRDQPRGRVLCCHRLVARDEWLVIPAALVVAFAFRILERIGSVDTRSGTPSRTSR